MAKSTGGLQYCKSGTSVQGPGFLEGIHSLLLDPVAPRQSVERQMSQSKTQSRLQLPKISNMKC